MVTRASQERPISLPATSILESEYAYLRSSHFYILVPKGWRAVPDQQPRSSCTPISPHWEQTDYAIRY